MKPPGASQKFKVYYDGMCVVCSKEIGFYRTKTAADALEWVDISAPHFDPTLEGLDTRDVTRVFHVRTEDGRLVTGVDAFIEIWRRLPELKNWVRLSQLPGARFMMKLGYHAFVRIRPFLPRRKGECPDGVCRR